METQKTLQVVSPDRLDRFLAKNLEDSSRTYVQSLIVDGNVRVNGDRILKKNHRIEPGDSVEVNFPEPVELSLRPRDVGLKLLYEDDDLLFIHKPAGILTHPNHAQQEDTVVHGLLHLGVNLSSINGVLRPGIVHRLDRETSGVMVIARTNTAHQNLQEAFAKRRIQKVYFAICYGREIPVEGEVNLSLGRDPKRRNLRRVDPNGREARTRYQILKSWDRFHFLRLEPASGRTHQIRVHLKALGIGIAHDREYGSRPIPKWVQRLQLHAFSLRLTHPIQGVEMLVRSPLEEDMQSVILRLNRGERYVS